MERVAVVIISGFVVLIGFGAAVASVRDVLLGRRLRNSGVQVEASIVSRHIYDGGDHGNEYFVTTRWEWLGIETTREFNVPLRVYRQAEDGTLTMLIDPNKPENSIPADKAFAPSRKALHAAGYFFLGVAGVLMFLTGFGTFQISGL